MQGLTYQETLRTLGTLLDQHGSDSAVIVLVANNARLMSPAWRFEHEWTPQALAEMSGVQRGWRSRPPPARLDPAGIRHNLRAVGAELDAVGQDSYMLLVQPRSVQVHSRAGYERTFDAATLDRLVVEAAARRTQSSSRN